jgi:hypothetical protein
MTDNEFLLEMHIKPEPIPEVSGARQGDGAIFVTVEDDMATMPLKDFNKLTRERSEMHSDIARLCAAANTERQRAGSWRSIAYFWMTAAVIAAVVCLWTR